MKTNALAGDLREQTRRALWEISNVIACVPDAMWDAVYGGMPVWKHVYHTLHSLDRWLVNPRDPAFAEPPFHRPGLNDLDTPASGRLSRETLTAYLAEIREKTLRYLAELDDAALAQRPAGCEFTRMALVMGQHRHLATHMGMLMGFIASETGLWPRVLGLEGKEPEGGYGRFF